MSSSSFKITTSSTRSKRSTTSPYITGIKRKSRIIKQVKDNEYDEPNAYRVSSLDTLPNDITGNFIGIAPISLSTTTETTAATTAAIIIATGHSPNITGVKRKLNDVEQHEYDEPNSKRTLSTDGIDNLYSQPQLPSINSPNITTTTTTTVSTTTAATITTTAQSPNITGVKRKLTDFEQDESNLDKPNKRVSFSLPLLSALSSSLSSTQPKPKKRVSFSLPLTSTSTSTSSSASSPALLSRTQPAPKLTKKQLADQKLQKKQLKQLEQQLNDEQQQLLSQYTQLQEKLDYQKLYIERLESDTNSLHEYSLIKYEATTPPPLPPLSSKRKCFTIERLCYNL